MILHAYTSLRATLSDRKLFLKSKNTGRDTRSGFGIKSSWHNIIIIICIYKWLRGANENITIDFTAKSRRHNTYAPHGYIIILYCVHGCARVSKRDIIILSRTACNFTPPLCKSYRSVDLVLHNKLSISVEPSPETLLLTDGGTKRSDWKPYTRFSPTGRKIVEYSNLPIYGLISVRL